jgi:hypothetical protein
MIDAISDLNRENFGSILHVIRFAGDRLGRVVNAINGTGYGLTLGLRAASTPSATVEEHARVGNFYVSNQIGAVVESQPFGGEGLSTGPKAGGPHMLRFRDREGDDRIPTPPLPAAMRKPDGNAGRLVRRRCWLGMSPYRVRVSPIGGRYRRWNAMIAQAGGEPLPSAGL